MPTINVTPSSDELLEEIAHAILKSRKVVVITGAGISTNLGIPDFRSENGLYALISEQYKKFDYILEKRNNEAEDGPGPRKRRKLDRSQSLPSSEALNNGNTELTISKRSLRSSNSSLGIKDVPSRKDEEPQSSTVSASRYSTPSDSPLYLPQLPQNVLSNVKGKDLFDAVIWTDKRSTETHYTFITSLKHKIDEVKETSEVHKFIRVLRDGGRLVRNYTQNIDMLEAREGLCTDMSRGVGSRGRFNPKLRKQGREGNDHQGGIFDSGVEVVQLHGNLEYLRCTLCLGLSAWEEDDRHLTMLAGQAPACPKCIEKTDKRVEKGRRGLSVGTLRPDIVLYGEASPQEQIIGDLSTHDILLGPDMLIILGTSLRVHGLKTMLREFAKAVHTRGGHVVFVNNTKPPDSVWGDVIDYWIQWDCDEWVRDVKSRREEIWMPQGSSRESSPKLRSSDVPPKNPQANRTAQDCGAYLSDKILRLLREDVLRTKVAADRNVDHATVERKAMEDVENREFLEKIDLEAKERMEKIRTSRLQSGKLLQSQLALVASKQVAKRASGAKKSTTAKSAVASKTRLLPVTTAPNLPPVGTWKPPSKRQPILAPTPVQTSTDLNANGKRGRGTRPAAVREDKNNFAHLIWCCKRNLSRIAGLERTVPETAAGRKTLLLEERKSARTITEPPPKSKPAPAPTAAPAALSISVQRPANVDLYSNVISVLSLPPKSKPAPAPTPAPAAPSVSVQRPANVDLYSNVISVLPFPPKSKPAPAPAPLSISTPRPDKFNLQSGVISVFPLPPSVSRPQSAQAPLSVSRPRSDNSGLCSNVISVFPLPGRVSRPGSESKMLFPAMQNPNATLPLPKIKVIRLSRAKPTPRNAPILPGEISNAEGPVSASTPSNVLKTSRGRTLSIIQAPNQAMLSPMSQPPKRWPKLLSYANPKASTSSSLRGTSGSAMGSASSSAPGTAFQVPQSTTMPYLPYQATPSPDTPVPAPKPKRTRKSRAKPKPTASNMFDNDQDMVGTPLPRVHHTNEPSAAVMINTPASVGPSQTYRNGEPLVQSYDARLIAKFQPSYKDLFGHPLTPAETPTSMYQNPGIAAAFEGASGRALPRTRSGNSWNTINSGSQLKDEVRLPTPPSSDNSSLIDGNGPQLPVLKSGRPMTPNSRRIKKLGSISSILSSPPPQPPTLSKASQRLMQYPPPHAEDQNALWSEHPHLDALAAPRREQQNAW